MIKTAALLATAAGLSITALFVGAAPHGATPPAVSPISTTAIAHSDDPPAGPHPADPVVSPMPPVHEPHTPAVHPARRPRIDMVFALDTTGSMGGLLEGAKQKIWHIVSSVAQGQPAPIVRVGLVAYRDHGDAYVTRVTPLSRDMDAIYASLHALSAGGGGDTPEDVDQALYDAVHKLKWAGPQSNTLRVLFLVGDAPPHTNYQDVPSYQATLRAAARRGIVVNAIRCGTYAETGVVWNRIARLGHGKFLSIDQNGGMVATHTPYDGRLAALSGALDDTYVPTGSATRRADAHRALHTFAGMAAEGGGGVAADRAAYRAHAPMAAPAAAAKADVVTAFAKDKKSAEATLGHADLLPARLRKMSLAERKAYVAGQAKKREAVRKQILDLSRKRSVWIAHHAPKATDGFDAEVVRVVREQAAEKAHVKY